MAMEALERFTQETSGAGHIGTLKESEDATEEEAPERFTRATSGAGHVAMESALERSARETSDAGHVAKESDDAMAMEAMEALERFTQETSGAGRVGKLKESEDATEEDAGHVAQESALERSARETSGTGHVAKEKPIQVLGDKCTDLVVGSKAASTLKSMAKAVTTGNRWDCGCPDGQRISGPADICAPKLGQKYFGTGNSGSLVDLRNKYQGSEKCHCEGNVVGSLVDATLSEECTRKGDGVSSTDVATDMEEVASNKPGSISSLKRLFCKFATVPLVFASRALNMALRSDRFKTLYHWWTTPAIFIKTPATALALAGVAGAAAAATVIGPLLLAFSTASLIQATYDLNKLRQQDADLAKVQELHAGLDQTQDMLQLKAERSELACKIAHKDGQRFGSLVLVLLGLNGILNVVVPGAGIATVVVLGSLGVSGLKFGFKVGVRVGGACDAEMVQVDKEGNENPKQPVTEQQWTKAHDNYWNCLPANGGGTPNCQLSPDEEED